MLFDCAANLCAAYNCSTMNEEKKKRNGVCNEEAERVGKGAISRWRRDNAAKEAYLLAWFHGS